MIKTFIWDKYQHFCLDDKTPTQINEIVKNDKEFIITEKDAFVIGLTNVLYTSEVLYKFKQYLLELLINKSFDFAEEDNNNKIISRPYINQQILIQSINSFKSKIPKNWASDDIKFKKELESLPLIYETFIENVKKLVSKEIQEWPCVKCAQVKKIINKLKNEIE